jgi:histidinol phosphatase-like PHP family hydrolase
MIDLHTHTLLSDGVLIPSELVRRAEVKGYRTIALTDHADAANIESVIAQLCTVAATLNKSGTVCVIAGVELTHIPPKSIKGLVARARELGAQIVVGHGESIAEPVAPGTNSAFISSGVDVLAHPGLVTAGEAKAAAKRGVYFEITSRGGHSLTNGHVAAMAKKYGVLMLLNSDAHAPGDLIDDKKGLSVALGANLTKTDYRKMKKNAEKLSAYALGK